MAMNSLSTMPTACIVDNPSYFTMEGTACVPKSSSGAKPKIQRFKWLKMKNKVSDKTRGEAETQPDSAPSEMVYNAVESRSCLVTGLDPLRAETIYYNCAPEPIASATNTVSQATTAQRASAETDTDDDVFDDEVVPAMPAPATKSKVSGKALRKRRNSFGAWFRTSLSSVKRSASASSAATESASLPSSSRILPGVSSSAVSLTYRPEMKSKSRLPQPKSSSLLTSTSVAQPPSPTSQLPQLRSSVKSKITPTKIPAPPSLTKTVSLGPVTEPRNRISLAARNSLGAVTPASTSPRKRSIPQYCNQRVYQFSGTISLGRQFDRIPAGDAPITASACAQYSQGEAAQKGSSGPANKHALVTEPKIDSIRRDCTPAENGSRDISDQTSRGNASELPAVCVQEEDNYLVPNQLPRTESCAEGNDSSASSDVQLERPAIVVTKAACSLQKSKSLMERRSYDKTQPTMLTTAFTVGCTHHKNPRRRCLRCTSKHDTMALPVYDVVILFSSKCEVSYAWTYYLYQQINEKLSPESGLPLSIWIRDIESLYRPSGERSSFGSREYVNQCDASASNGSAAKGNSSSKAVASQEHMRAMVFSARLQVILLSREVLLHVIAHAEDPLGNLFKPERVIALFVGLDEKRDINEYHRSALYSFRDWVHIGLEDGEVGPVFQFLEWSARILQRIPRLTPKLQSAFKLHPRRVRLDENKVMVSLTKTGTTHHQATVMIGTREIDMEAAEVLEWVNPWAFIFEVPDHFLHVDCTLRVMPTVDGKELGVKELQCRSKIRDLSLILKDLTVNPIHMLCQAMGVNPVDREELDVLLFQQFKGNFAWPGFSWFHMPSPSVTRRNEVFPTLLHFAARYGLERFAWALLECPGADVALQIENSKGLTPVGLAESHKFNALARCMREYAQVSEYSVLVDYARAVRDGEGQPFTVWDGEGQATYATLLEDGSLSDLQQPGHHTSTETQYSQVGEGPPRPASYLIVCGEEECPKTNSLQDELIEIMQEFKNKTVTINQAEQLFHQWRQRVDVEKSMAEKAKELEEMRKQFETIQKELRSGADQKKQSPFDKLSRFLKISKDTPTPIQKDGFPRTPERKDSATDSPSTSQFDTRHSNPNPIDCSSSDRLSTTSTASAVSNSDSGAHSDSGDDPHLKVVPDYARPPPGRFPYTPPSHQCINKLALQLPRYQVPPKPRAIRNPFEIPEELPRPRPPPRRPRAPVVEVGGANDEDLVRPCPVDGSIYIIPGEDEGEEDDPSSASLHINVNANLDSGLYTPMLPSPHHLMTMANSESPKYEVKPIEDEYGVLMDYSSKPSVDQSPSRIESVVIESEYMDMTHSSLHSASVPALNVSSSTENRFPDSGSAPNLTKDLPQRAPSPFIHPSVSAHLLPNYEQKSEEDSRQSHSLPSTPSLRPRPLSPPPPPLPPQRKGPMPPPLPPKLTDALGRRNLSSPSPQPRRRVTPPTKLECYRSHSSEVESPPPPRPPKGGRSNPEMCSTK